MTDQPNERERWADSQVNTRLYCGGTLAEHEQSLCRCTAIKEFVRDATAFADAHRGPETPEWYNERSIKQWLEHDPQNITPAWLAMHFQKAFEKGYQIRPTPAHPDLRGAFEKAINACSDVLVQSNMRVDIGGGMPIHGASLRSEIIKAVEAALAADLPVVDEVVTVEAKVEGEHYMAYASVCVEGKARLHDSLRVCAWKEKP